MTEEERKAEKKRLRRELAEQEQSAIGGLDGFLQTILKMIKGFFSFLNDAISGETVGDGDSREIEEPQARESLFNGIRATASAAQRWAVLQRQHDGVAVVHRSPVEGAAIVEDDRHMREKHPIHGDRRMHHGVDMTAGPGNSDRAPNILASADGVVLFSGSLRGYGKTVIIGHADGTYSLYAHMSGTGMPVAGRDVKQGQVIGEMGSTGGSTGVHLHYEQRKDSDSRVPRIKIGDSIAEVKRGTKLNGLAIPDLAASGVMSGNQSASPRFASVRSTEIGARG